MDEELLEMVAKQLIWSDPKEAEKWWPALQFSTKTSALKKAEQIITSIEEYNNGRQKTT